MSDQVGKPCCICLGDKGAMWIEIQLCTFVPTEAVAPPIDITEAGDLFNAAVGRPILPLGGKNQKR
ncbi:hypothetical protein [Paenibacillus radicis (ex Xue et al. 2023)]|uniref:Uncharacterized protein n=1 Tax=Paenibacillus radicis (ex Xue et al. 2023) TaxID=2972489 RepID=A0ABT1YG27_9BACL|nr:hypothetical protein [Paenibacillus radicis (ex Xue et al. 2023)]MCR8632152.1 hypothetical protein [Paenibacillus radicis (ex Xue et al. 2023)]